MTRAKSATATFVRIWTLTTSLSGTGTITPAGGRHIYSDDASVRVEVSWNTSTHELESWGGACSDETVSTTSPATCTVEMTGNKFASATIKAKGDTPPEPPPTYDLTVTAIGGGTVSPTSGEYVENTSVKITASWNESTHTMTGWGGACASAPVSATSPSECRVTMDGDKTASATFAPIQYTLTTVATGGGSVSPASGMKFNAESPVTITATWNSSTHAMTGWSGECSDHDVPTSSPGTCTFKISSNTSAGATFEEVECTVTPSWESAHGTVVMDPTDGTVTCGAAVSFEVTPATAYCFRDPTATDPPCSTETVTYAVSTDKSQTSKTVTVAFEKVPGTENPECTVVGASNDDTLGNVTGGATVPCGQSVTLTAVEKQPGGRFTGWDWSACDDTQKTCEVTTNASATGDETTEVTGTFAIRYCTVTVTAGTGGSASGGGRVQCGANVTINATASENYCFGSWSGILGIITSGNAEAACPRTDSATLAAKSSGTVRANFTRRMCTVTGSPNVVDRGSVSGSDTVPCGNTVTLTATEKVGGSFTNWSEASCGASTSCTITTSGRSTPLTVTANFAIRYCTVAVTAGAGGSASGGGRVQCGANVTINATASRNYCFGSWSGILGIGGNAESACPQTNSSTLQANSSGTATANFTRQSCRVNGSASPATYGIVSGSDTVPCGNRVPLTATPHTHYRHTGWSSSGCGTATTCRFSTQGNWGTSVPTREVTAYFEKKKYTLTVNGGSGDGTWDALTWRSISAPAAQCVLGYSLIFDRWSGDSTSTSRTTSVYMNRDKTVTATYLVSATPCTLGLTDDSSDDPVEGPSGTGDAGERSALHLLAISDGTANALALEWFGGPANADRWQYRTTPMSGTWSEWTDIPGTLGSARSYRITGLASATTYSFEVRPVVDGLGGEPSNVTQGATQRAGVSPAEIAAHQIAEGDGVTQWRIHRLGFVITIPNGIRLRAGAGDGASVTVQDMSSGSYLTLSTTGEELGRELLADPLGDVAALFDQILASVTQSPVVEEALDSQP